MVPLEEDSAHAQAQSRGHSQLDLDFALAMHRKVKSQLAPPAALLPYLFRKDSSDRWEDVAAQFQKTAAALRQEGRRLRRSHWERFGQEVAQIVSPADKADETRYLYELLFRNPPLEV